MVRQCLQYFMAHWFLVRTLTSSFIIPTCVLCAEGPSTICGPRRASRGASARRPLHRGPRSSPTSSPCPSPCPRGTDLPSRPAPPPRHQPQASHSTESLRAWYPKCYPNFYTEPLYPVFVILNPWILQIVS